MKMRIQLVTAVLLVTFLVSGTFAQNVTKFETYSKELSLTQNQKEELILIITESDKKLEGIDISNDALWNKVLKEEISKIYHLLSKEQFAKFKEIRPHVEEIKQFRSN